MSYRELRIAGINIGLDSPSYIIVEISARHNHHCSVAGTYGEDHALLKKENPELVSNCMPDATHAR